nr:protein transport protein Sec16A-like [Parasteatoda tepidariorum]
MILPDDKNPTIVWDDVKNCWVNKDSNDDEDSSAPVAPPTDSELMGSKSSEMNFQSPTNSSFPPVNSMVTNNSVPPSTASSQPVNKFQRPKTRGMRQNYVDVLSTSGVTKKNVIPEGLFTPSYDAAVSPNVFMPPAAPTSSENTANVESSNANYNSPQLEEEQQLENQTTPMMFNPAEFDSRRPSISNQRHTIGRMGRRTYPT